MTTRFLQKNAVSGAMPISYSTISVRRLRRYVFLASRYLARFSWKEQLAKLHQHRPQITRRLLWTAHCRGTLQRHSSSKDTQTATHLAVVHCKGTSTQAPKVHMAIYPKSKVHTAAPCSGTSTQAPAPKRPQQRHPATAPAPSSEAHTVAALQRHQHPSSSTRTHSSSYTGTTAHPAAAPAPSLENAHMQLFLFLK